jgi:isopenicillin-N epimerase
VPLAATTTNETCAVSNPLQHIIWQKLGIEVPVVDFRGQRHIRVSCHLYNDTTHIDRLVAGLKELLRE